MRPPFHFESNWPDCLCTNVIYKQGACFPRILRTRPSCDSWNNIPCYKNSYGKGPCEALMFPAQICGATDRPFSTVILSKFDTFSRLRIGSTLLSIRLNFSSHFPSWHSRLGRCLLDYIIANSSFKVSLVVVVVGMKRTVSWHFASTTTAMFTEAFGPSNFYRGQKSAMALGWV